MVVEERHRVVNAAPTLWRVAGRRPDPRRSSAEQGPHRGAPRWLPAHDEVRILGVGPGEEPVQLRRGQGLHRRRRASNVLGPGTGRSDRPRAVPARPHRPAPVARRRSPVSERPAHGSREMTTQSVGSAGGVSPAGAAADSAGLGDATGSPSRSGGGCDRSTLWSSRRGDRSPRRRRRRPLPTPRYCSSWPARCRSRRVTDDRSVPPLSLRS
jgi:hypothetical protein